MARQQITRILTNNDQEKLLVRSYNIEENMSKMYQTLRESLGAKHSVTLRLERIMRRAILFRYTIQGLG